MKYDPSPIMLNGSPLLIGIVSTTSRDSIRTPAPPDGPPLDRERVERIESDVARCLHFGAWEMALEVLRRARTALELTATDEQLQAWADGPRVDGVEPFHSTDHRKADRHADLLARLAGAHLLRGAVGAALVCLSRRRNLDYPG